MFNDISSFLFVMWKLFLKKKKLSVMILHKSAIENSPPEISGLATHMYLTWTWKQYTHTHTHMQGIVQCSPSRNLLFMHLILG